MRGVGILWRRIKSRTASRDGRSNRYRAGSVLIQSRVSFGSGACDGCGRDSTVASSAGVERASSCESDVRSWTRLPVDAIAGSRSEHLRLRRVLLCRRARSPLCGVRWAFGPPGHRLDGLELIELVAGHLIRRANLSSHKETEKKAFLRRAAHVAVHAGLDRVDLLKAQVVFFRLS